MAARQEEGRNESQLFVYVVVCKWLSNDNVGVAWGTVFEEIWPGAGFKTGDFVKNGWGGYRRTTPTICDSIACGGVTLHPDRTAWQQ